MKILHTVESYLPERHGMSEVVKQLSEYLVKVGHEVTVATKYHPERATDNINGVTIRSFKISGNLAGGIKGEREAYEAFLLEDKFDVITNFAAQQWATDVCLPLLPLLKARKVFVPTGFSGLYDPIFAGYYIQMKTWMLHYDMNVFLSNRYRDIDFARELGITKLMIIPNGASYEEFTAAAGFDLRSYIGVAKDTKIILHVGSYTGMKGHDQALDIFVQSGIKDAVLVFVGHNFNSKSSLWFQVRLNWFRGFLYRGFYKPGSGARVFLSKYIKLLSGGQRKLIHTITLSREQVVAAFKQANLLLFPSLIECSPVVLFEAMAAKTPFLVTDVGNSPEIIEWSHAGMLLPTVIDEHGFSIADTVASADLLCRTLYDDDLLKSLGEAGYQSWLSGFTWEKIADIYNNLYNQLVYAK